MSRARQLLKRSAGVLLSEGTMALLRFDLLRLRARLRRAAAVTPSSRKLHFGSGGSRIEGWWNVDLLHSDQDLDLVAGSLPWADGSFDVAMSEHVIEHLELRRELLPLLREIRRVLSSGGEIWVSCPDMEKICRSYLEHGMADLIADREERSRKFWARPWSLDREVGLRGVPASQMVNSLFYQGWEHRNLFDFELLRWALEEAGFGEVERVDENALREKFPEIPLRGDDAQSLYVRARAAPQ